MPLKFAKRMEDVMHENKVQLILKTKCFEKDQIIIELRKYIKCLFFFENSAYVENLVA